MKKIVFTLIAIVTCFALNAETWTLGGTDYTWTIGETRQLGSATTYSAGRLTVSGSPSLDMTIFYTITDLTNQNVEARVVPASKTSFALKTVSNTAATITDATPIAGINAGFFNMSSPYHPNGFQVIDGQARKGFSGDGFSTISFNEWNVPFIGSFGPLNCYVTNIGNPENENCWVQYSAINSAFNKVVTGTNGVTSCFIFYTSEYGSSGTNGTGGYAVKLTPKNGAKLTPGKYTEWKVVSTPTTDNLTAPAGGIVLYGYGTGATFIKNLTTDKTISIYTTVNITDNANNTSNIQVQQAAGGSLMILDNGNVITSYANTLGNISGKEPRTAIGYNADKTKLVMLVVDGRNTNWTNGCNGKILGAIMKKLGCSDALNLDGGGSSQFWTSYGGLVNDAARNGDGTSANPTYIRPVAETIFIVELPTPVLSTSTNTLSFNTSDNATASNQVTISGTNLRGDITLALSGTNADQFQLSATSIAKASANGSVTITYKPTAFGSHTATLTISSTAATSKTITLSGTNTETVVTPPVEDNSVTVGSLTCNPGSITLEGVFGSSDNIYTDVEIINTDANRYLTCASNTGAITITTLEDWNETYGGTIRLTLNTNFSLGVGTHTSFVAVECKHSTEEKYRIEIGTTVKLTEDNTTAIEEVEAEVGTPVEYYNLQGAKVSNPEKGLYIKRQGNKVSKVIL